MTVVPAGFGKNLPPLLRFGEAFEEEEVGSGSIAVEVEATGGAIFTGDCVDKEGEHSRERFRGSLAITAWKAS